MEKIATVYYDGEVFRPEDPVDLEPNTRYIISIGEVPASQEPVSPDKQPNDVWQLLERLAGTIDGPTDWSAEHDHYLYGTPKRSEGASE